jgi:hypothetical protein
MKIDNSKLKCTNLVNGSALIFGSSSDYRLLYHLMSVLVVMVLALLLTRRFVRHLQLRVSGFLKQLKFNQVNKWRL